MAGLRVGGLASGMDIDQIVGDLMKAQRIPLDKLLQKKTTFEWQRDSYRSINTKLKAFDTYLFDNFTLTSNFNKKTVTVSNENTISASASSTASGALAIDSIEQLASASYGVGKITSKPDSKETTGITESQNITLSVLQSDGSMKDVSLTFNVSDTIDDVAKKLNDSGAGVTAFYDKTSGQFSISAKATGNNTASAEILVKSNSQTDVEKSIFTKLGFATADVTSGKLADNGSNAILTVNGAKIERNSNNFTIAGFNITLKEKTAPGAAPITLAATTDVDNMVDKVKEFVSKYNDLISGMNSSLKEKKYRDFPPLTDEQRKDMTDEEQKLWDEKAKSGLHRSDSIVSGGLSDMRNAIYGKVGIDDNMIDTLAEMGITTSSVYSDGGKLVINEDKLKKALTENPDQVVNTFSQSGEKTSAGDTRGIAQRLRDSLKEFTTKIETKAGKATFTDQQYTIGKSLIDTNDRITNFQRRLEDMEARYWKQFTAMEQAISKANSQSGYLSQLGAQ